MPINLEEVALAYPSNSSEGHLPYRYLEFIGSGNYDLWICHLGMYGYDAFGRA